MNEPRPKIARVISSSELILNKGSDDGVKVGQTYGILDSRTDGITDPDTGEPLGDYRRFIARVRIRSVKPRMSYAIHHSGASSSYLDLVTGTRIKRDDPKWPEGVGEGDELQLDDG